MGAAVDVRLAVASKRDHRDFDPRAIPDDVATRILDAGRLAGSARNRQPWRFAVATDAAERARLAPLVHRPPMVLAAPFVVALSVESAGSAMWGFDAGRAAQNMMLSAWDEGVASCPNGIVDLAAARAVLRLTPTEVPITVLAFGYPANPRDPARRSPQEWSRRARRHSLERILVRL